MGRPGVRAPGLFGWRGGSAGENWDLAAFQPKAIECPATERTVVRRLAFQGLNGTNTQRELVANFLKFFTDFNMK